MTSSEERGKKPLLVNQLSINQQFPKIKYALYKPATQERPFCVNNSIAEKKILSKIPACVVQHRNPGTCSSPVPLTVQLLLLFMDHRMSSLPVLQHLGGCPAQTATQLPPNCHPNCPKLPQTVTPGRAFCAAQPDPHPRLTSVAATSLSG